MLPTTTSGKWLAGMAASVAALVIIAIAVSLLTNAGEPDDLPEGSPESTVQRFLLALQDADTPLAHSMLSAELQGLCSLAEFQDATRFVIREQRGQVRLERVRELATGTEVTVAVSYVDTSFPFTSDRSTSYRYLLHREDGEWRLTDVQWPFIGCRLRPAPAATPEVTVAPAEA